MPPDDVSFASRTVGQSIFPVSFRLGVGNGESTYLSGSDSLSRDSFGGVVSEHQTLGKVNADELLSPVLQEALNYILGLENLSEGGEIVVALIRANNEEQQLEYIGQMFSQEIADWIGDMQDPAEREEMIVLFMLASLSETSEESQATQGSRTVQGSQATQGGQAEEECECSEELEEYGLCDEVCDLQLDDSERAALEGITAGMPTREEVAALEAKAIVDREAAGRAQAAQEAASDQAQRRELAAAEITALVNATPSGLVRRLLNLQASLTSPEAVTILQERLTSLLEVGQHLTQAQGDSELLSANSALGLLPPPALDLTVTAGNSNLTASIPAVDARKLATG